MCDPRTVYPLPTVNGPVLMALAVMAVLVPAALELNRRVRETVQISAALVLSRRVRSFGKFKPIR